MVGALGFGFGVFDKVRVRMKTYKEPPQDPSPEYA